MGQIVVGTDGSEAAAAALTWAVAEGRRRGWPVTAVLSDGMADPAARRERLEEAPVDDPDAALAAVVADAVGPEASATVGRIVEHREPSTALLSRSDGASLLVVGTRGHGGIRGPLLGSVSQHCLHHSHVPVAVIRDAPTDTVRAEGGPGNGDIGGRVVVGVDGSAVSRVALAWALEAARSRSAPIEVVHCWSIPVPYGAPTVAVPDTRIYEEAALRLVDDLLAEADTSGLPAPVVRTVVAGGSITGVLCERAADADLLVVGSRGVGGFRGMLVGSVAHQLAHHAPCPLVVVPFP